MKTTLLLLGTCLCLSMWMAQPLRAASTASDAVEAVEDAGKEAVEEVESWWHKIQPYRLKNRTPDEIVAWIIIGVMVGGLAGAVTTLSRRGYGPIVNIAIGLVGAFVGGIAAHLAEWDLGWGPVLIRYEEVAAAFIGSVLFFLLIRFYSWRTRRREKSK